VSLILDAAQFAEEAHRGQVRKYKRVPYVYHPARVAGRVALHSKATEDMVAAAFLHDVVEDTPFNLSDISIATNDAVAAMVSQLTNPSKNLKLPREDRKALDRAHLTKACWGAKIIKMIDRLDNLGDMDGCEAQFANLYAQESLLLAETVGDADPALKAELVEVATKMRDET
jgi:(p)ppGpp synthase/HD superfamily hydrolase